MAMARISSLFVRDGRPEEYPAGKGTVVFLLHGLANGPIAMKALEREAKRRDYTVINWGYKTRNRSIDEIASKLREVVEPHEATADRIHFVGHSMGGLVIRRLLDHYKPKNLGRVVMIGTPNQGADIAERVGDWKLFHFLYGQTGQDLRTSGTATARVAGIPCCEFGVIAGGTGTRFGLNPLIPGDDDGLVTVESTRIPGMADWIRVPHGHGYMQIMPQTVRNTFLFLETGRFEENAVRDYVRRSPEEPGKLERVQGIMEMDGSQSS